MNSWINLTALWQIVVVGLLAGAGLPAIFAIGLRFLNTSGARVQTAGGGVVTGTDGESDRVYGGNPAGLAVGVLCFAIVLAAIGYGIYLIVASS
ncbi:MAG: hypothetical protein ABSF03_16710 [Streptosporangiaceae bacterium]